MKVEEFSRLVFETVKREGVSPMTVNKVMNRINDLSGGKFFKMISSERNKSRYWINNSDPLLKEEFSFSDQQVKKSSYLFLNEQGALCSRYGEIHGFTDHKRLDEPF